MREKYGGRDQVHTSNGSGMQISNIGHATLHSPIRNLHLKNVLHVPSAIKILFPFIALLPIIMFPLNFIPTFSLLRIGQQRQLFIKEGVKVAFIL
jgi:hypothetical protein